jgi:hypothetical protein
MLRDRRVSLMRATIPSAICVALLVAQCDVIPQEARAAHEIKVLLLHGKSGKPLPGKEIVLYGYGKAPSEGGQLLIELRAQTGSDGMAVFRLKDPLPRVLLIDSWQVKGACELALFDTQEVLSSGVVNEDKCLPRGKLKGKISPEPGRVVIFGLPHTWWDGLLFR